MLIREKGEPSYFEARTYYSIEKEAITASFLKGVENSLREALKVEGCDAKDTPCEYEWDTKLQAYEFRMVARKDE